MDRWIDENAPKTGRKPQEPFDNEAGGGEIRSDEVDQLAMDVNQLCGERGRIGGSKSVQIDAAPGW